MILILMGVSGVGKTTIGSLLAQRLDIAFFDGDDFHSTANIAKMQRGEPLTDGDRAPWLASLQQLIQTQLVNHQGAVIACSALKGAYRQQLSQGSDRVRFILLTGSFELIQQRLSQRPNHFMAASLLASQFKALETPADSLVIPVDRSPEAIAQSIITALDPKPDRSASSGP
ncbi:gluconokinase [Nodosilinea sp. LEGE 07088]|nr:gluconokinase [Nodosilinea sp. LEGE 07088]